MDQIQTQKSLYLYGIPPHITKLMNLFEALEKTTIKDYKGYRKLSNIQKQICIAWGNMIFCVTPPPPELCSDENFFCSIKYLTNYRQLILNARCEAAYDKQNYYMQKACCIKD
jgi:hypothetical protein